MRDEELIISPQEPIREQRIEICRSYDFKLNMERVAGPELRYESRSFFCSAKTECAFQDAETTADKLHAFAKAQVLKAVRSEIAGWRKHDEKYIWSSVAAANATAMEALK